jgi:SNF2 family DNA or RNA helicase
MLVIDDTRAVWQKADLKAVVGFSARLEGRKSFAQGGAFRFEPTGHNVALFRERFPDVPIDDKRQDLSAFEDVTVAAARPLFAFKTQPYPHQVKAFEKLRDKTAFALLLEMGLGKSKCLSDIIAYKWCKGEIDAAVILSPKGVHSQWVEEQLPTHMSVPFEAWAWEKSKTALAAFEQMLAFNGLQVVTMNVDAIKGKDGAALLERFIASHKGRVLFASDEIHTLKNPSSQRSKIAYALSRKCVARAGLTGSPIANNIADVFGEFKFLDERIIGNKYFSSFRSEYCVCRDNGFGLVITGAKNLDKLYAKIDPYVFRATKDELDLPPKIYDTYQFELSEEQKKHYKDIKQSFLTKIDDDTTVTVANAASAIVRLQQISSGYLPQEDGSIVQMPNPRLEALLSVLESIEGRAIIWARFTEDVKSIAKALGKRCVTYYGDTTPAEREKARDAFLDPNSGIDYFVSNPAAGGTGLNLQGACQTAIYYSNSFNATERWQSEDRIHRIGTKGAVTYIDLVAKSTVDTKILANLRSKKSLSDYAIDEIRKEFFE